MAARLKLQGRRGVLTDLEGRRFNRWTVLKFVGFNKHKKALWRCCCECGTVSEVVGVNLTWGISESCGCLRTEQVSARAVKRNLKHGHAVRGRFSPEYRSWVAMLGRCERPGSAHYAHAKYYAAIGVKVCERWKISFQDFFADMGKKPSSRHSLDRYPDPAGNYEPGNCRWATAKQQRANWRKRDVV